MVNFETSKDELRLIIEIAARAVRLAKQAGFDLDFLGIQMDLAATHCNGCPLKLQELLDADDENFAHDVGGIHRHLNRKTGKLEDCFCPRYAQPEPKKEVSNAAQ